MRVSDKDINAGCLFCRANTTSLVTLMFWFLFTQRIPPRDFERNAYSKYMARHSWPSRLSGNAAGLFKAQIENTPCERETPPSHRLFGISLQRKDQMTKGLKVCMQDEDRGVMN